VLIVFDLDDTLYLERDYAFSGFRAVDRYLEARGTKGLYSYATALFLDGVRGTIFDGALKALRVEIAEELIQELVRVYREHVPTIQLAPDAIACLSALKDRHELALITDGPSASQWRKIEALGLGRFISKIIVTDDLGSDYWKPSRKPFEMAQGRRDPRDCVYVGDNPGKDFVAPRALGWRSIRICRKDGLHTLTEDDVAAPAHVKLTSLVDLSAALDPRSR